VNGKPSTFNQKCNVRQGGIVYILLSQIDLQEEKSSITGIKTFKNTKWIQNYQDTGQKVSSLSVKTISAFKDRDALEEWKLYAQRVMKSMLGYWVSSAQSSMPNSLNREGPACKQCVLSVTLEVYIPANS